MNTYNPIYYEQNRERIIATQKRWQKRNKDKVNARQKRYHTKHKEEINQRRREKYKKKQEKYKKLTIIHDADEAAYGDIVVSKNKEKK